MTGQARTPEESVQRAPVSVTTWLVLRQALLAALPEQDVPGALRPGAFGLPADFRVAGAGRDEAWRRLVELGIATAVPTEDDLSTALPDAAAGLKLLVSAPIRTVVHSWRGRAGTLQVMAWDGSDAIGVSRRMRRADGTLRPAAAGDDAVEMVWLPDASPVREIVRALPPAPDPKDFDTAVIGWEASYDESGTQRDGTVPRLGDVPTDGLARLGSLGTDYDGGAQVTILRTAPTPPLGEAAAQPVFTGLWVWTPPADGPHGDHPLLPRLTSALSTALSKPTA